MHAQRPNLAAVAHDLPGHRVLLADGDELGVVAEVVETAAPTDATPSHALVVDVDEERTAPPSTSLLIAGESVLTVTDDAVVLGTTALWLDRHTVVE